MKWKLRVMLKNIFVLVDKQKCGKSWTEIIGRNVGKEKNIRKWCKLATCVCSRYQRMYGQWPAVSSHNVYWYLLTISIYQTSCRCLSPMPPLTANSEICISLVRRPPNMPIWPQGLTKGFNFLQSCKVWPERLDNVYSCSRRNTRNKQNVKP